MSDGKTTRAPHLRWVPIAEMSVSPRAQREFRPKHAASFAADFDLESLGYPVVNLRDGRYYIVDGQHRVGALKLIGWGDQQIQCECYEGLTEAEEAELYLRRGTRLKTDALDEYRIAILAGRAAECDIDRIVRSLGLAVSREKLDGRIMAVSTLRRVYQRGPSVLAQTLRIIRDAYGTPGFEASVIDGIGLVCSRYHEAIDETNAVQRLGALHGGVNGLIGRADALYRRSGYQKAHCVAAATVEVINRGQGRKNRLADWFRPDDDLGLTAAAAS